MNKPLTITIQSALLSDAMALRQLSEQTFFDTYTAFNTPENTQQHIIKYFNLNQIQQELVNTSIQYLLAKQFETLIGFAKLVKNQQTAEVNDSNELEIQRFYIHKSHQGQQLGFHLMNSCIDWAIKAGFDTLWLGVWEHNPNAIQFYEKMGFSRCGTHTFTLGSDIQNDFLMKKRLLMP